MNGYRLRMPTNLCRRRDQKKNYDAPSPLGDSAFSPTWPGYVSASWVPAAWARSSLKRLPVQGLRGLRSWISILLSL